MKSIESRVPKKAMNADTIFNKVGKTNEKSALADALVVFCLTLILIDVANFDRSVSSFAVAIGFDVFHAV